MPVAPSFSTFEFLSEPYEQNKKMYIKVRNPKTKTERIVRWYTQIEYNKAYPNAKIEVDKYYRPLKSVLGFDNNYIMLIRGEVEDNFVWLADSVARYHKYWGWYIISTVKIPNDIPANLKLYKVDWDLVSLDDKTLRQEDIIKKHKNRTIDTTTQPRKQTIINITYVFLFHLTTVKR